MAESSSNKKRDEMLQKNLAHLKKRALDVKFDLDTTEYTPIENIGIGAYGVVCSAIHKKTNDRVAIKKIPGVFDYKDIAKRTYREIKILKHFTHDNVIHIREILKPKETLEDFKDIYVVFDLMESDLHKIIYSKQELTEEHVRYFLYQILRGLKYIHSADVIHRDLKPSNLLVNEDCQLRIGDFGMARGISSLSVEPNYFMTQYVATRWYRAPEIMLSLIEYGAAVDMWSVGCIFAEMLGRKHLFPGKDSISQIKLIVGLIGTPKENLLQLCHSPIIKTFVTEMGHKDAVPLQKLFPKASKKALNLLGRMLVLHPQERITVEQALVHPYLNKYHDPDDEPICIPVFNFNFEKEELSVPQLRDAINTEIMEYHKPRTPTFSFNACLRPVPKPDFATHTQKPQGTELPSTSNKREITVKDEAGTSGTDAKNCPKPIVISKQSDEEVFKKPLSAQNKEASVRVDIENLLKTDLSDVEMLSAKSASSKQPMSATEEKLKENKDPVKEEKHKTISEDTKNLIKAAIMNECFKKRTDSVGEDDRPRPITAAMRQKEREDKRKKKKEKTLERKRKEKKKIESKEEILTSEDKELLNRWTKMQHANVPIAPKPPDPTTGVSSQSQTSVGQAENNTAAKPEAPSFPTNQRNVQQETLDLLQQRLLANASSEPSNKQAVPTSFQQSGQTMQPPGHTVPQNASLPAQSSPPSMQNIQASVQSLNGPLAGQNMQPTQNVPTNGQNVQPASQNMQSSSCQGMGSGSQGFSNAPGIQVTENSNPVNEQSEGPYSVDFSNVNLGDLDFLTILSSPEVTNILTQTLANEGQMTTAMTSMKSFESQNSLPVYTSGLHQGEPGAFLEHLCAENRAFTNRRISQEGQQPVHSSNQLSVSPNYQNQVSPPQFFSGHSPGSQHSISPNHIQRNDLSPNHNVQPSFPFSSQPMSSMLSSDPSQNFHPQMVQATAGNVLFQGNNLDMNNVNPGNLFMSSSQGQPGAVSQANQAFMYRDQTARHQEGQSSSNSNSPPSLSINVQEAQMTMRQMFQEPVAGPSEAGNQMQNTHVDLVALLSKQLSKSYVDDLCPQLALTPRGTGGGYGVGVDLDALMMAQEQDGSQPAEPSPLSSSILEDWMEVTSNLNIDLEALEQELQSPMVLSYNDLNLYSS